MTWGFFAQGTRTAGSLRSPVTSCCKFVIETESLDASMVCRAFPSYCSIAEILRGFGVNARGCCEGQASFWTNSSSILELSSLFFASLRVQAKGLRVPVKRSCF